jgi:GLPGLI family protein
MKRLFFTAAALFCIATLQAQVKQGVVTYERKNDMYRVIQDEQMRAMMPQFRTSRHQLLFNDSVSVYRILPEDEAPDPFAGGNGGIRMVFRGAGSDGGDLYKNFSQSRSVQANETAGKNYLIIDTIQQQPWKLDNETKQIMGHTCHKATRKTTMGAAIRTISMGSGGPANDTTNRPKPREVDVVAWYADDMLSPAGPDAYGLLPGVILQLDIDKGATVYTATDIKTTVDPKDLKEPKKGKQVSRQEYQKFMADLMGSQMQGMPGGVRFRMN